MSEKQFKCRYCGSPIRELSLPWLPGGKEFVDCDTVQISVHKRQDGDVFLSLEGDPLNGKRICLTKEATPDIMKVSTTAYTIHALTCEGEP